MKITYREAMRQALHDALATDPRVFLMGEDVGRYGGSYAVSKGLLDEFGPERIRDTPLSELALRRRRHRRRAGRHAADRRGDDGQLQPAGARPDREHGGAVPAHVGRPVQRSARDPHGDRRRPPARGAALAQPRELVRARAGHHGGRARHDRRRARHAGAGARRPRSGGRSSSTRCSTTSRASSATSWRSVDIASAKVLRAGPRRHDLIAYGGTVGKALDAAAELAAEGIEAEVDRPARAAPARRRDDHGVGAQDAPRRGRRRRLAHRQPGGGDQRPHHGAGVLRSRCTGRARVQRGGADPLREAPRGGGAAAAGEDRRGGAAACSGRSSRAIAARTS